jgi:Flp pilus assembly protein TadG
MLDWPAAQFAHRWLRSVVRRAKGDRRGAVAMIIGLALSVMLGVAGLAVDASMWQYNKNNAQAVADAAALSAVTSALAGDSLARIQSEVYSIAAAAGYVRSSNVTVTINNPPTTGNYAGNSNAYEVIIAEAQPRYFSLMYTKGGPTVYARSVALVTSTSIASCVVSLASSGSGAVSLNGNGSVDLTNCNLDANSTNKTSLTLTGNASVTAQGVHLAGGFSTTGNASIVTPSLVTNGSPVTDPYANRVMPSDDATNPGCFKTNYSPTGGNLPNNGAVTVYCGNLSFSGNTSETIPAGIYIIDKGGSLSVSGNASLTGTGVTFIFTSSTGGAVGSFNISGNGSVNLTAPATGPTAGIVFWVDKAATSGTTSSFTGNGNGNLTGAIYAPSSTVDYSGNGSSSNGCMQIVSNKVSFTGNATLSHYCTGTDVVDPTNSSGKGGKPVE